MPHLIGTEGLAAGTLFALLAPTVTIGRDAESDIMLMDRAVSLRHAHILTNETGQVTVHDAGSDHGVFVNEARVVQATLAPGDLLQIGDSVFRFEA